MSVLQKWVENLPFMQQSVLIAAVRGPDGIRKDHPVKVLCRWYRRCILKSAFDKCSLCDPLYPGGGSFTGPSLTRAELAITRDLKYANMPDWYEPMLAKAKDYLRYVDELPHHFQLHFMHAAEILGYKHHNLEIAAWWNEFYLMIVNDAHLHPESEERMDWRLGDKEINWRAAEVVTAKPPAAEVRV